MPPMGKAQKNQTLLELPAGATPSWSQKARWQPVRD
jgi:hypothetical protein